MGGFHYCLIKSILDFKSKAISTDLGNLKKLPHAFYVLIHQMPNQGQNVKQLTL